MDLASLEICKELYELSGWNDPITHHYHTDDGGIIVGFPRQAIKGVIEVPAYHLGYLLRKLPPGAHIIVQKNGYAATSAANTHTQYTTAHETAKTPEDAAAKLCITLIHTGVISVETRVGGKNGRSKLTEEDVTKARTAYLNGVSTKELALAYEVHQTTIQRAIKGMR